MDMRISSVYNAYSVQSGRGTTRAAQAERTRDDADLVSLSARAGDYNTARVAVAAAPDVRESLVSRLQEMIESGTYRITAQQVAARIME